MQLCVISHTPACESGGVFYCLFSAYPPLFHSSCKYLLWKSNRATFCFQLYPYWKKIFESHLQPLFCILQKLFITKLQFILWGFHYTYKQVFTSAAASRLLWAADWVIKAFRSTFPPLNALKICWSAFAIIFTHGNFRPTHLRTLSWWISEIISTEKCPAWFNPLVEKNRLVYTLVNPFHPFYL